MERKIQQKIKKVLTKQTDGDNINTTRTEKRKITKLSYLGTY